MDIISHTLSGLAVGTVVSSVSKEKWTTKLSIVFIGGLGGALPDLDAISLWSRFDSTIGKLLNLAHTGNQIYFGKFWYSHHGAFHSLLAPLLISLVAVSMIALINNQKTFHQLRSYLSNNYLKYLAFFFGFTIHLLEDMLTPGSVWGGVNFFWPSSQYVGGFGKIWWWNNYDLVLIIFSVFVINSGLNFIKNNSYQLRLRLTSSTFIIGTLLTLYQINARPIDFSYSGHTTKYDQYEYQSKQIQKEILGESLYQIMIEIDNKIPLYF